ncbi:S8 family serine peptidase [Kinneretia asaccharophila]|uniref:Fn3 domain-containing protein n=1 Tax=Roseateles asaccharophilus TaxID=582607 RepID=A0A4R6NCD1_9BURK|nr:S8 family serine peptidase [Roseateles asaccharophilus]MDN3543014.1 S8 family serine peptidase [Roseateles asaccharophilus]TDP13288.1 Fn3 domain-containing protein [Roseateles asaccharophilus]
MSAWKFSVKPVVLAIGMIGAISSASVSLAQSLPAAAAESSQLWFVELAGRPVADGASLAAVQAEQNAFRAAASQARLQYTERRAFNSLFNGLAVSVSAAERAKLARMAGVKALHPIEVVHAPTPEQVAGSVQDLNRALALSRADVAQNSLGLTGAGIKVGIIDSGIDIDHPAFGGSGSNGSTPFPSARIVAGWDFVGDSFNADPTSASYNPTPTPDARPDDCGGHGTHVAGIVGANGGGLKGVAPDVKLGAYRVFGCNGSTTSDIILAALEQALADGMQVINQSLGASRQWPQYPTAQASARLARKGVVMVASIGNSGPGGSQPDGLYAAGAPGVGDGVIGVASFDNAQTSFKVGGTPYGYNPASGVPLPPLSGGALMARTGAANQPDLAITAPDACSPLPEGSLSGRIALIRRGSCGFYNKAFNAQAAGAVAVVLYNNQPGAVNANAAPNPPNAPAVTIPVVGITAAQGKVLHDAIGAGDTLLSWTGDSVGYPFGTGGLISGFSSFGLAADLSFKPDIGGPGGGIYSAYPLEAGGYATLSGTSMSAPHVAGVAALVLQAIPTSATGRDSVIVGRNAPPAINMHTRLLNTAKPKAWSGNPASGLLDHSFRQGAGMVDVVAAVQSQQFVLPAKISTGESQAGPTVQRLTIRNDAAVPVTYQLGHTAGVAARKNNANTGASYAPTGYDNAPATVSFSSPTVVVPAKGTASVTVTIAANAALQDSSLYGGYITLTPQGDGSPIQVPYAGFKGDYQALQVLSPGTSGFPWLARLNTATNQFQRQTEAASFTMVGSDVPYVLLHLDHQPRTLKVEALDAATLAPRGVISEEHFLGRSGTPNGFQSSAWNGTTSQGTLPNGNYLIRVSVLKALGNAAEPSHWETWNSVPVQIARPAAL